MNVLSIKSNIVAFFGLVLIAGPALEAHPDSFKPALADSLIVPYLQVQQGLASDDLEAAKTGARVYLDAMKDAPQGRDAAVSEQLRAPAEQIATAAELESARSAFATLSQQFQSLVEHVGTNSNQALYLVHCPMAFGGRGGDWIQSDQTVANPYYGKRMLRCGTVREQIAGGDSPASGENDHGDTNHSAVGGNMDHDQYSAVELDRVHAGVSGYQSRAAAPGGADSNGSKKNSSACGMGCCTTGMN